MSSPSPLGQLTGKPSGLTGKEFVPPNGRKFGGQTLPVSCPTHRLHARSSRTPATTANMATASVTPATEEARASGGTSMTRAFSRIALTNRV
eukprot:CAMPEP_0173387350 /NCGR_PEP_ID=MMETSP1356-20130122/9871_1 /TAXON_ID=77927 ORGANISM="Hemiselmis virescens, Strain PCC157" /NCGR_SAMPLE_ID=MMETSP1356 /ASSEMBLY_ACC=CAM_ASM_000847 /LENGTH=91 /DNA_ID=CAMNT_0014343933 /DNA_START=198 /DNA_END=473 /DNA_ORIENTATION=+